MDERDSFVEKEKARREAKEENGNRFD